jgi:hypothetical protein
MAMTLEGEAFQKASLRDDVATLLRERRFEDALQTLYRARAAAPSDPEIQTAIDQLKDFMVTTYARQLGGMDKIAPPIPSTAPKTSAGLMVAQYVDGRSTFGDISQVCPLGQLRTLQVLVELYVRRPNQDLAPPASGLRPQSAPPGDEHEPDTHRSPSVAAGLPYSSTNVKHSSVGPSPSVSPGLGGFLVENEADRQFKELFAKGTAAFIQNRYRDAVDAFQECMKLRPEDKSVEVMLRRSLKDLQEQLR